VDCGTGCFAGFIFLEGPCFGSAGVGGDFRGVKVCGREDSFGFGRIAAHATFWVEGGEGAGTRARKGTYDGCYCSTYLLKGLNRKWIYFLGLPQRIEIMEHDRDEFRPTSRLDLLIYWKASK